MLLILEILYIKLLICIFLLETMFLFFSNEFSVIYMYSLKNLNNFELMDKQEAIIVVMMAPIIGNQSERSKFGLDQSESRI